MMLPISPKPEPTSAATVTAGHVLEILQLRRSRSRTLGENLFSDPAWDILLELYAAKLDQRSLTLSELAPAIATPTSTTARWVALLKDRGLIESEMDSTRPIQVSLRLTEEGLSRMERLLGRLASAFEPI